ncbi:MAG: NUDIX domain-containing protein [Spirochaetales bacterium]|nr:NUDIX domain-containing protein [Spirochaetales bacterium]
MTWVFKRCPNCGAEGVEWVGDRFWRCPSCRFEYFHNVAAAAGVIVDSGGGVLLFERTREPSRGLLALPGGFVDPGERAEDAAMRECREELGWTPSSLSFLATFPNRYEWNGVPYSTCDLFFSTRAEGLHVAELRMDETEGRSPVIVPFMEINYARLAFESTRRALRLYTELQWRI